MGLIYAYTSEEGYKLIPRAVCRNMSSASSSMLKRKAALIAFLKTLQNDERMNEMTRQRFLKAMGTVKRIATVALILTFGGAGIHAQEQRHLRMTFSGTSLASQLSLQPGTSTGEETLAGRSSFGDFTYHEVVANTTVPTGTCGGPTLLYFPVLTGAGVFRFEDGSLLITTVKDGSICVDLTIPQGHVTVAYEITGGTGLFKNASGTLTLTATSDPVLFDAMMRPIFFAASGKATGMIVLPKED